MSTSGILGKILAAKPNDLPKLAKTGGMMKRGKPMNRDGFGSGGVRQAHNRNHF